MQKKMFIPFKLRKMLMIRLVIWRSGSLLSSFLHRIMMILCFQRYLPPCFLCLCLMQISSHLYKNEKSVCPHKWGFWIRQWFLHLVVKLDDVGTDQNPWSHALEEGVEGTLVCFASLLSSSAKAVALICLFQYHIFLFDVPLYWNIFKFFKKKYTYMSPNFHPRIILWVMEV